VAGGQVADICPSHTQPGLSQHFGDQPRSSALPADLFNWGGNCCVKIEVRLGLNFCILDGKRETIR